VNITDKDHRKEKEMFLKRFELFK